MRGGAAAPLHSVPHLTIPYESDDTAGICSMENFYKVTGLTELVKDRTITDVRQIWMNKEVCEGLEEIVERNLRRQRKYRRGRSNAGTYAISDASGSTGIGATTPCITP